MKSDREFTGTLLGFDDFVSESATVSLRNRAGIECAYTQTWC
jgi:hypothetical protein